MQVDFFPFFWFCAVLFILRAWSMSIEIGTPESPEALTMNLVNASTSAAHGQHPAFFPEHFGLFHQNEWYPGRGCISIYNHGSKSMRIAVLQ